MAETEKKSVTGLDTASNRKDAEYNLVEALLGAAEYKNDSTEVEIKRNGVYMFSVHIRALSDTDTRFARKKATILMDNPNGKKLPKIEKEFDNAKFKSWLIYVATTPEDQEKIWGNEAVMRKFNLMFPVESIDILLTAGEKLELFNAVTKLSGLDDDGEPADGDDEETQGTMDEEEYAGN